MDFIGWIAVGVFLLVALAAVVWQSASDRRRRSVLRTFASDRGMVEIPGHVRVPNLPAELRRSSRMPAFRSDSDSDGAPIFVVPLTTRVRWGYAWALCARCPGAAPVLALNLVSSDLWRRFGRMPRSWMRARVDETLAQHFTVYVPSAASIDSPLPEDVARTLIELRHNVVAWIVRSDGVAVLMLREPHGVPVETWLSPLLDAFPCIALRDGRGQER